MTRLQKFLSYKKGNSAGWLSAYEDSVINRNSTNRTPWLLGHYSGLVKDIVDLVGIERLSRLADVMSEIDDVDVEDVEEKRRLQTLKHLIEIF